MKTKLWFILALAVLVVACKDDDDGDDGNQTMSDDIEVSMTLMQGNNVEYELDVNVATGGVTGNLVTMSSVDGNRALTVSISDGNPDGSYTLDMGGTEAAVSFTDSDPQNPKTFTSSGGTVDVSRFEKVGENDTHHYYEMDLTIDATMQDNQTSVVYELDATVKNAFIAELK